MWFQIVLKQVSLIRSLLRVELILSLTTERFTDLGKLNFLMVFRFRLKPIYTTVPAASKNYVQFKSGQN